MNARPVPSSPSGRIVAVARCLLGVDLLVALIGAAILPLSLPTRSDAIAGEAEKQVCDVDADFYLGVEDYAEAIRLHRKIVQKSPDNALAHYHLGFAEGMIGDRAAEVAEYQGAESLGLKNWDLFLNLGLAEFENDDLEAATDSFRKSVLLGGEHPESHFNLALVDEKRGMLAEAGHEIMASLRLSPEQSDARNMLGVIYAEEGKVERAAQVWRDLMRDTPDYEPARANLSILSRSDDAARHDQATLAVRTQAASLKSVGDESRSPLADVRDEISPKSAH